MIIVNKVVYNIVMSARFRKGYFDFRIFLLCKVNIYGFRQAIKNFRRGEFCGQKISVDFSYYN